VLEVVEANAHARILTLSVPGWEGSLPGQHVDIRLTAEDGYQAVRSYSLGLAGEGSTLEIGVDGVEAEAVLLGLDQAGVAAHSGSACSSESLEPSPVLAAMGVEAERSLRVSVGWPTTDDDVTAFCEAFPKVVERLRALR
jgi:selenocysteine lyase/cysteine desulfurase